MYIRYNYDVGVYYINRARIVKWHIDFIQGEDNTTLLSASLIGEFSVVRVHRIYIDLNNIHDVQNKFASQQQPC